jgi:ATP-binding cassette, subfamily C (CFTR/MRP), member 1
LNRVSADMDKVDSHLPDFFLQSMQNLLHCVSIFLLCISSMPVFIVLMLPISVVFVYVQHYFRKTSREVKRLESVSRSPLYVLCSEVIGGMATIRAFGRQKMFQEKHRDLMDENCRHNFMYWMVGRWLSLRLETLSNVVVLFVGILAVLIVDFGGAIDGNLLGLALVYSVQLTGLLQWTVRTVILTEDGMTSVERIVALENIKQERAGTCEGDPALDTWPTVGKISFKNLSMRYRPELPLVLKNVQVDIPGGCKVGIVGRTGSGKSSLVLALFRLVEPESSSVIEIDGVNTLTMGLDTLRSQLTVIPQDPIMFSGTIRFNLDPFQENSDTAIWEALDRAQLKEDILEKFPGKLNHMVSLP